MAIADVGGGVSMTRVVKLVAGLATAGVVLAALAEGAGQSVPDKVGTKAPAFTATSLDGQTIDTTALAGKVVVLKFWYVACGPCRVEIPHLNRLVEEFAGKPVVFLGLALDAPDKLRLFLKEMPFAYTIVPNAESIFERFGVTLCPTHVVIDRQGTIVHFARGGSPQTADVLRSAIKAALGE